MRVDFVTLFPEMVRAPLDYSILKRARDADILTCNIVDLRDFASDSRGTVDDTVYGGGPGMLLRPDVLFRAVESLYTPGAQIVLVSPQGEKFHQRWAEKFTEYEHLIFICAHYEGVDERVRQALVHSEFSIGDYVLTNGNLAALVIVDAVTRLLPGVLGSESSTETESFTEAGMLDYPQYTKPAEFRGMRVPDILFSGDHAAVENWRREQALNRTVARKSFSTL